MKRIYIFAVMTIMCYSMASAQQKGLVFDPRDGMVEDFSKIKLRRGESLKFKIYPYNPFLYDASINGEIKSYNLEMSEVFNNYIIDLKGFNQSLGKSDRAEILKGIDQAILSKFEATQNKKTGEYQEFAKGIMAKGIFLEALTDINEKQQDLDKINAVFQALKGLAEKKDINPETIVEEKNTAVFKVLNINGMNESEGEHSNELHIYLMNTVTDMQNAFVEINKSYNRLMKNDQLTLLKLYSDIQVAQSLFDQTEYTSTVKSVVKYYQRMVPSEFQFEKVFVINEGSELEIDFSLTPKQLEEKKEMPAIKKSEGTLSIPILSRLRFNFSEGLFLSNAKLVDHAYSTRLNFNPDTDTVSNQIFREDEGNYSFGIGGMAHVYYEFIPKLNPALSFGAMVNDKGNVRYLLGASVIVGRKNRVVFNFSRAWGKAERLSSGLKEGDFIESLDDLKTKKKSFSDWTFGISYSFPD